MNNIFFQYLENNWDRLADLPRVVILQLRVTQENRIVSYITCIREVEQNLSKLSLWRMIFKRQYTDTPELQNAFIFETPLSTYKHIPNLEKTHADVIIGFLPHPNAKKNVNVEISIVKKSTILKCFECFECFGISPEIIMKWKCCVHPSHVMSMTPFVYGAYPYPYVTFKEYDVKLECDTNSYRYTPTLLCANFDTMMRINIKSSTILLPNGKKLCPFQNSCSNNITLPDLQTSILNENTHRRMKERHDVIFKELMEKTWSPQRITLEMIDT